MTDDLFGNPLANAPRYRDPTPPKPPREEPRVPYVARRMPPLDTERFIAPGRALFPYQRDGATWTREMLLTLGGCIIGDDMGLGKTCQTLLAIPPSRPVVVVCPAVVKENWCDEIRAWRTDLRPFALYGRGSFKWPPPGVVAVTNAAILPALDDAIGEPHPGTILVVDEAHAYASSKTLQTKTLRMMRRAVVKRGGAAVGATGTPLLNRPQQLWAVLASFGVAEVAFGSWPRFVYAFGGKKRMIGGMPRGYEFNAEPSPKVADALRRVMLRRLKVDVLTELPPKLFRRARVTIDADAARACDAAVAALRAAGIDLASATLEAIATSAATVAFAEMSRARAALAAAKIRAAEEIVEEYEDAGKPLLVLSDHRAPVLAIGSRDGWAAIHGDVSAEERHRIVSDFQSGKIRHGVAVSIRAGGVGITLTRASDVLRIDRAFTPGLNAQAEDRVHRIGQKSSVTVTDLVAMHVLDERMDELEAEKRKYLRAVDSAAVR